MTNKLEVGDIVKLKHYPGGTKYYLILELEKVTIPSYAKILDIKENKAGMIYAFLDTLTVRGKVIA
jgi:hypothetical protein